MPLTGHVWIAHKKEGIRPARTVVCATQTRAEDWLDEQCANDPHIEEWDMKKYNKTVYRDEDENVVGYFREVPTKAQYEQMADKFSVDRTVDELRKQEAGVLE